MSETAPLTAKEIAHGTYLLLRRDELENQFKANAAHFLCLSKEIQHRIGVDAETDWEIDASAGEFHYTPMPGDEDE